jgi:hypothetical protein
LRRRRKAQDEEISWAVVFQVRCLAIPTTRPRFRGNVVEAGRVSDSAGGGAGPRTQHITRARSRHWQMAHGRSGGAIGIGHVSDRGSAPIARQLPAAVAQLKAQRLNASPSKSSTRHGGAKAGPKASCPVLDVLKHRPPETVRWLLTDGTPAAAPSKMGCCASSVSGGCGGRGKVVEWCDVVVAVGSGGKWWRNPPLDPGFGATWWR